MKLIVNPHTIEIQKELVNEKEINITKCEFEFAEEITDDLVKKALFTLNNGTTYDTVIVNNECDIPYEVLQEKGQIEIGVIAYQVEDDEYVKRFNPSPAYFSTLQGSLKESENAGTITPSDLEQYEQALQDGLTTVNGKIEDINTALQQVDNLDIDASKSGDTTTVTITKKNGTEKSVLIKDGDKGDTGNPGKDGKDGQDGVDGFSPIASVSKVGSTATITVTDKNGTTTTTISDGQNGTNGQDGQNGITPTIGDNGNWYLGTTDTGKPSRGATGQNGADGQDGVSPTATVSKSGTVATISITDKNGTTTATINDGTNCQNGQDGVGVPSGGTQGQVLVKSSGTDYDTTWGEASGGVKVFYRENGSGANRFDFDNNELGLYYFYSSYSYFQYKVGNNQASLNYLTPIQFLYTKKFADASLNEEIGTLFACRDNNYSDNGVIMVATIIKKTATTISNSSSLYMIKNSGRILTTQQQLISGEKIFGNIPKQNGTTAPTENEQFTNKKYVDDQITEKIGSINTILASLTTPGGE